MSSKHIIWSPREIEKRSLEMVEAHLTCYDYTPLERAIVKRVIHSTGDPSLADSLLFYPRDVNAGLTALRGGADIYTDVNMLKAGISSKKLAQYGGMVYCMVAEPQVAEQALQTGVTRSAAAMYAAAEKLTGAVIAIGNAPTALFAVLNLVARQVIYPAFIVGVPVGFIGAAESKAELAGLTELAYITLPGTRGGTPVAAAIINAMLGFTEGNEC